MRRPRARASSSPSRGACPKPACETRTSRSSQTGLRRFHAETGRPEVDAGGLFDSRSECRPKLFPPWLWMPGPRFPPAPRYLVRKAWVFESRDGLVATDSSLSRFYRNGLFSSRMLPVAAGCVPLSGYKPHTFQRWPSRHATPSGVPFVGCAEHSEAHLSRSMRFVTLTTSYARSAAMTKIDSVSRRPVALGHASMPLQSDSISRGLFTPRPMAGCSPLLTRRWPKRAVRNAEFAPASEVVGMNAV